MSGEVVHRLGVFLGVLAGAGLLARRWAAARRDRRTRRRLAALMTGVRARDGGAWAPVRERARRWAPPVAVAGAGWVLVGGVPGLVTGLAAAVALRWWRARRTAGGPPAGDAGEAADRLPLAADLLAACIAAGAGPVAAARAVGEALGGPVGDALARGAAEVRLGGAPAEAWQRLGSLPGAAGLARLLERAGESGSPAAEPVARLAAGARAEWARAATARARRAAVLVTVPVGLCFLPAFIAVGVLPVVIGLAGGAWGGGGR
ncbi:type II secretion system F family protein [Streptomyces doudnae]|uniref:Type II secretion system F family protein n=3 Tax=Streptomyces TaxID=1883 RepID=A0ABD5EZ68_9ACTN|nr:type II secretion system F family protein [Streptomyces sp. DSM 41981]MDT0439669.1 type II secretion system F family protein [Streptomyces sp. DSM 41981]